jgi:hypothetical protein
LGLGDFQHARFDLYQKICEAPQWVTWLSRCLDMVQDWAKNALAWCMHHGLGRALHHRGGMGVFPGFGVG